MINAKIGEHPKKTLKDINSRLILHRTILSELLFTPTPHRSDENAGGFHRVGNYRVLLHK